MTMQRLKTHARTIKPRRCSFRDDQSTWPYSSLITWRRGRETSNVYDNDFEPYKTPTEIGRVILLQLLESEGLDHQNRQPVLE